MAYLPSPGNARLYVVEGKARQRALCLRIDTGLELTVKFVDILDELAVEEMQRNALRAYAAALAAVCAAAGNVECTDDVEHSLLKGPRSPSVRCQNLVLSKTHLRQLHAGHIAAGVAADAATELILEESELFFRAHGFDLLDLCKAVCVLCVAALADGLVENLVLLALADMAALQHAILIGERLFTVERLHGNVLVCIVDRDVRDAL